jgi:UPF0755 protein
MGRDPRVEKFQRLRHERRTRAGGSYYGTQATAAGSVLGRPRRRDTGRTLLSLVIFVAIIAAAIYVAAQLLFPKIPAVSTSRPRMVTITVAPGETRDQVAAQLQDAGVIANAGIFRLYMSLSGQGGNILAGQHTFRTGMNSDEILKVLASSPPPPPATTIQFREGLRAEEIAALLDKNGVAPYADVMKEILHGSFNYPFLADRPAGASVEGFLLPDTYAFFKGRGAHYAVNRMLRDFDQKVSPALVAQGKKLYGSFYQAVIMASIVEREAGTSHDRYLIAGVYTNRLFHDTNNTFNKVLNADPTVQYAVGQAPDWWPILTDQDLSVDSPFNTYKRSGLPPHPIANPSVDSIQAAVNPASTDYFYFYHVNGSHGKSIFCTIQQGSQCPGTPQ